MTFDDLEHPDTEVEVVTSDTATIVDDVVTETTLIEIRCAVDNELWTQILASRDDALVFVTWLESKRADDEDEDDG
jgi:hypothetical protein